MDDSKFDEFTRLLAVPSRLTLCTAMATAIGAALFGDDNNDEALANRTKRKRGRRKQAKRRPSD